MRRSCRRRVAFAAVIPSCVIEAFLDGIQQINQAEAFAGIIALASLGERLRGVDLIHFVDNLSALAGFIGGTATQEDSVAIFAIFHVLLVHCNVRHWAEHVESLANIADGPSRNGDQDHTSHPAHRLSLPRARHPRVSQCRSAALPLGPAACSGRVGPSTPKDPPPL